MIEPGCFSAVIFSRGSRRRSDVEANEDHPIFGRLCIASPHIATRSQPSVCSICPKRGFRLPL